MQYTKFQDWESRSGPFESYTKRKDHPNRRKHHRDERVFHGPLTIPLPVREAVDEAPVLQDTCRHLVVRVEVGDIVWVFRDFAGVDHTTYIGEVVYTRKGKYRVHVWRAVDRDGADLIGLIDKHRLNRDGGRPGVTPLMPPLAPPKPAWRKEDDGDPLPWIDPEYSEV